VVVGIVGVVGAPGIVVEPGIVVPVVSGVVPGTVVEVSEVSTLVVVMSPGMVESAGMDDVESVGTEDDVGACTDVAGADGESLEEEKKRKASTASMNTTAMAPIVTGVNDKFFMPLVSREIGEPDAKPSGSFSFFFFTFLSLPSVGTFSEASRRRREGDSVGMVGEGPNEPGWASWKPPGCGVP
jgi:hypothetical protein